MSGLLTIDNWAKRSFSLGCLSKGGSVPINAAGPGIGLVPDLHSGIGAHASTCLKWQNLSALGNAISVPLVSLGGRICLLWQQRYFATIRRLRAPPTGSKRALFLRMPPARGVYSFGEQNPKGIQGIFNWRRNENILTPRRPRVWPAGPRRRRYSTRSR